MTASSAFGADASYDATSSSVDFSPCGKLQKDRDKGLGVRGIREMVEKDLINVSEEMSVIHEKMFDNKVHHLQNGFSDVQRAVILITQAPKYQLYNILACKKIRRQG